MSEDLERRFLDAIGKDPTDAEARAVYADWLEERGDPRGEYLRLELQLYQLPVRLRELAAAIEPRWLEAVSRLYDVQLARAGTNKIGVIKEVRQVTGFGLKEAKDAVESASDARPYTLRLRLDRKEADELVARFAALGASCFVVGHYREPRAPAPRARLTLSAIEPARRIEAIKHIHDLSGLGLAAAKQLVERVLAGERVSVTLEMSVERARELAARFDGVAAVAVTAP